MKQNITYKQWRSLSEKAQQNLQAWWKLRTPPLLSIGQMIEFLDEHCGENCTAWSSDRQCRTRDIMPIGNFGGLEIVLDPNTVICDALWEACKEVLEK